MDSELTSLTLKHQWLEQDKERLLREAEGRTQRVREGFSAIIMCLQVFLCFRFIMCLLTG